MNMNEENTDQDEISPEIEEKSEESPTQFQSAYKKELEIESNLNRHYLPPDFKASNSFIAEYLSKILLEIQEISFALDKSKRIGQKGSQTKVQLENLLKVLLGEKDLKVLTKGFESRRKENYISTYEEMKTILNSDKSSRALNTLNRKLTNIISRCDAQTGAALAEMTKAITPVIKEEPKEEPNE